MMRWSVRHAMMLGGMLLGSVAVPRVMRAQVERTILRPSTDSSLENTADSLSRMSQKAMASGDENGALTALSMLLDQCPTSVRVPQALYHRAFLLYRLSRKILNDPPTHQPSSHVSSMIPMTPMTPMTPLWPLRLALSSLQQLHVEYPTAPQAQKAQTLRVRVCGELAQGGDTTCLDDVTAVIQMVRTVIPMGTNPSVSPPGDTILQLTITDTVRAEIAIDSLTCVHMNLDAVLVGLSSIWKIDTTRAISSVQTIMPNRERCFDGLRRRTILTMIDRKVPILVPLMIDVAQHDPAPIVRRQATMWLTGQSKTVPLTVLLHGIMERSAVQTPGDAR